LFVVYDLHVLIVDDDDDDAGSGDPDDGSVDPDKSISANETYDYDWPPAPGKCC